MDTTEQYVKMCDCPEIQDDAQYLGDNWEELGNWFAFYVSGKWQKPRVYTYGMCLPYESGDRAVWLPRQDQLQGMLPNGVIEFDLFRTDLDEWAANSGDYFTGYWKSPEQAWLAFVMHELHGKKWDGKEWVE